MDKNTIVMCSVLLYAHFPFHVTRVSSSLLSTLHLKQLISFQSADSKESTLRKMQRPTKDSKFQPDNEVSSTADLGRSILEVLHFRMIWESA